MNDSVGMVESCPNCGRDRGGDPFGLSKCTKCGEHYCMSPVGEDKYRDGCGSRKTISWKYARREIGSDMSSTSQDFKKCPNCNTWFTGGKPVEDYYFADGSKPIDYAKGKAQQMAKQDGKWNIK